MLLRISDWEFDVDAQATRSFSSAEAAEHCQCPYCLNFYKTVDQTYPNLRSFLAQFGLDIEAPDELMPFLATHISNLYAVSGSILKKGSGIKVDGVTVFAEEAREAMINTECPRPYFVLTVGPMDLPWILDIPLEEVESPANQPSFLKRMIQRIFKGNKITS